MKVNIGLGEVNSSTMGSVSYLKANPPQSAVGEVFSGFCVQVAYSSGERARPEVRWLTRNGDLLVVHGSHPSATSFGGDWTKILELLKEIDPTASSIISVDLYRLQMAWGITKADLDSIRMMNEPGTSVLSDVVSL